MKTACGLAVAAGLVVLSAFETRAETVSVARMRAMRRLVPLEKITVGPDDQYFAALRGSGRVLVFTHKADLVAQLRAQNLATGEVRDLLPENADSAEATFGPDGRVAFTYYRFSARGDICWTNKPVDQLKSFKEEEVVCLKRGPDSSRTVRSNPFWRSMSEIGYLERDVDAAKAKVVVENVQSGQRSVLVEGPVWAPFMRPGGRFLVYNRLDPQGGTRHMVIRDLQTKGAESVARLALPGISGFPILSEDERFLYFSHFINDTNDDHTIDGSDNAVVFRVPVEKVLAAKGGEVFPEQLTSVETSCSFPIPVTDFLYVTCAFEGSLDIYQMPASGVIPVSWDEKLFANAIDTARSYQDRILFLDVLKYRFQGGKSKATDEKLLGDHILAGDFEAALYYLDHLAGAAPEAERAFYAKLRVYLEGALLKARQPSEDITRELREGIARLESKLGRARDAFTEVARARLKDFVGDEKGAAQALKNVRFQGAVRPLERVIYFELAEKLARPGRLPAAMDAYIETTRRQLLAPELNEQTKIHAAYQFLERLGGFVKPRPERIRRIEEMKKGLSGPLVTLFDSEISVLKICEASQDAGKFKEYGALDKLMVASKTDYFLRRALYIRAITNFADASEFKFMGFIGDNWLKYTAKDDTEYAFAREFFAASSLDRAYDNLAANRLEIAANYFYQAVSITDDLEAHYGYINTRVRMNQRQVIDERYKSLVSQQLVEDNMKFVAAVLTLADHQKEQKDVKFLDEAIASLNSMVTDRDTAMRNLVLGYCYLEKLLRTADGYEIDGGLFQEAHRSLMLAYDLGRDNRRIRASALMDLGVLHSRAQNYGVASRFFELRKNLGFNAEDERARFAWLASRAYRYTRQFDRAAKELSEVPGPVRRPPIDERQAFALTFGGRYDDAESVYHKLYSGGAITGGRNLATTQLTFGYALLKNKKPAEAARALQGSLAEARKLKKEKHDKDHLIDFEPLRVQLAATGLLAQAAAGAPEERIKAREERWRVLGKSEDIVDDVATLKIQNRLQLAEALRAKDPKASAGAVKEALSLTEKWGEKNQYFGNSVYRAVVAGLVDGAKNAQFYGKSDAERAESLTEKFLQAIKEQKSTDPVLGVQRLKVELLKVAFERHHGGLSGEQAKTRVANLLAAPETAELKAALAPPAWTEMEKLASGVQLF